MKINNLYYNVVRYYHKESEKDLSRIQKLREDYFREKQKKKEESIKKKVINAQKAFIINLKKLEVSKWFLYCCPGGTYYYWIQSMKDFLQLSPIYQKIIWDLNFENINHKFFHDCIALYRCLELVK